jgi:hypothetical protein
MTNRSFALLTLLAYLCVAAFCGHAGAAVSPPPIIAPVPPPVPVAAPPAGNALQSWARTALSGKYGCLGWKEPWARLVVAFGLQPLGIAGQTFYGPQDRRMNHAPPADDLWFFGPAWLNGGRRYHTSENMCARNPEIPWGSVVWCESAGLRIATDAGGRVKLGRTQGATAEFDYYCAGAFVDDGTKTAYAVLRWGYAPLCNPPMERG